jgi:predicted transcriptional regulator
MRDHALQLQCILFRMKTSTFPSLRVDPALRKAAEDVLEEGETLSSFVEKSVRAQIRQRQQQVAFIARGLASRDRARDTGSYVPAEEVVAGLRRQLDKARRKE